MSDRWFESWKCVSKDLWDQLSQKNSLIEEKPEILELLFAAHIYIESSVEQFGPKQIHESIDHLNVVDKEKYRRRKVLRNYRHLQYFSNPPVAEGRGEYSGSIHMSSASFRIIAAISLACRDGFGFNGLADLTKFTSPEWNRKDLRNYLCKFQRNECSGSHELAFGQPISEDDLGFYVAIVVASRDEFGRRDTGGTGRWWRRTCTDKFPHISRCQVIEAQMNLISIGLAALS